MLIAADVGADMAASRAWHEIHAETVVVATPAETAPTHRFDSLYLAGPQDDGLRRILLAHRFVCAGPPTNGIGSLAPGAGDVAPLFNPLAPPSSQSFMRFGKTLPLTASEDGCDGAEPPHDARSVLSKIYTINAIERQPTARRHYTVHMASAPKRVANAGDRWDGPVFATAATSCKSESAFALQPVLLDDRHGRDRESGAQRRRARDRDDSATVCPSAATCTFQRHVADGHRRLGKPFSQNRNYQAQIPPADLVVIDDLSDRIPAYVRPSWTCSRCISRTCCATCSELANAR